MAKEINFTAVAAINVDQFQSLLHTFEDQTGIHVNLNIVGWETYRADFVNIALQRRPVDVSLVGMATTSDLLGMNVLRPFSTAEIDSLGGDSAFLPERWKSAIRPGSPQIWAIPWLLDIRVFYYWRDMLAKAGLDESTAFRDHEQIKHTLECLSAAGLSSPWSTPTARYTLLHTVASWIWANGGDLFAPGGRQVIFHEQPALNGMLAYFTLHKYGYQSRHELANDPTFLQRQTAITVGHGWAVKQEIPPELGCAPIPGGSFLGGPDLIIWGNTHQESAALELVRFLVRPETQALVSQISGLLPVNTAELARLSDSPSPVRQMLAQAAHTGRVFACTPMIGLVEDRLSTALLSIQDELDANPDVDIETLLLSRIVPLGNRTNISLS